MTSSGRFLLGYSTAICISAVRSLHSIYMNLKFIKIVSLFLIFLQLGVAIVEDGHHTETVFASADRTPQVSTHHCDQGCIHHKEIKHYCLACIRHANSNPVLSSPPIFYRESTHRSYISSTSAGFQHKDFYVSASKRGPPPFFS